VFAFRDTLKTTETRRHGGPVLRASVSPWLFFYVSPYYIYKNNNGQSASAQRSVSTSKNQMTRLSILIITLLIVVTAVSLSFLYWNASHDTSLTFFSFVFPLTGCLIIYFLFLLKNFNREETILGASLLFLLLIANLFFYFLLRFLLNDFALDYGLGA
jgi:hypothetical protein